MCPRYFFTRRIGCKRGSSSVLPRRTIFHFFRPVKYYANVLCCAFFRALLDSRLSFVVAGSSVTVAPQVSLPSHPNAPALSLGAQLSAVRDFSAGAPQAGGDPAIRALVGRYATPLMLLLFLSVYLCQRPKARGLCACVIEQTASTQESSAIYVCTGFDSSYHLVR